MRYLWLNLIIVAVIGIGISDLSVRAEESAIIPAGSVEFFESAEMPIESAGNLRFFMDVAGFRLLTDIQRGRGIIRFVSRFRVATAIQTRDGTIAQRTDPGTN